MKRIFVEIPIKAAIDRLRLWVEQGMIPEASFMLWKVHVICKVALSIVWIWEGLVPKILYPSEIEIRMVESTGLAWWDASSFIPFLGACEIVLGVAILLGALPRLTAGISLTLLSFFTLVLPWFEPSLLYNPYGAITKNSGLIACSIILLLLAKRIPRAARCKLK